MYSWKSHRKNCERPHIILIQDTLNVTMIEIKCQHCKNRQKVSQNKSSEIGPQCMDACIITKMELQNNGQKKESFH